MRVKINDLVFQTLDDGTQVAPCPGCDGEFPSFTVTRVDGELRGFCPLCKFSITEPIKEEVQQKIVDPSNKPTRKEKSQDPGRRSDKRVYTLVDAPKINESPELSP